MNDVSVVLGALLFLAAIAYGFFVSPKRTQKTRDEIAGGSTTARTRMYKHQLVKAWTTAALALVILSVSGLTLARVGLGSYIDWSNGVQGMFSALIAGSLSSSVILLFSKRPPVVGNIGVLLPRGNKERLWFTAVAITAGITEEVAYRALPILVLHEIIGTNSLIAPAVIASIAFGLGHKYQGWTGIVFTGLLGGIFSYVYVQSHSLYPGMIVHALLDLRVLLINPRKIEATPT